jgi:hypothetical protein
MNLNKGVCFSTGPSHQEELLNQVEDFSKRNSFTMIYLLSKQGLNHK